MQLGLERDQRVETSLERSSFESQENTDLIKSLKDSIKEMVSSQRGKENTKIEVLRKMKDKQK